MKQSIMYLFNKYLWSFSKLIIMWTYNQIVKYLKNQNRSVYRVFKAESENIYNDCRPICKICYIRPVVGWYNLGININEKLKFFFSNFNEKLKGVVNKDKKN